MNKLRKMLPPLTSLLPFEATARLGSITKAGAELGLTQAAISKQIRSLEENLGTRLFERRNRAIHLNEDGRDLERIVSAAFESIGTFSQSLRQTHTEGEIVLHAQLCEGLYWLMPRLSKFYQQHPNIEVRVSVSTKPITETQERFDLALQTTGRDSGNAKLAFSVSDEVFPICSPKYLGDDSGPHSIGQLTQHRLLHHKIDPQDWIDWDGWLEQLKLDIRVGHNGMVYDSYPMMMQSVLEGHGIALAWRRTTEQLLHSGAVVRPFKEQLQLPDSLSVYHPDGWLMRKNATVLLDWLKAEFSS
ncbi:LysR substrate-binding domain-containing protein [Pelagibius sp. Alg239-R121]|uniref:LysR substrate-binding domain-containing protein n=1 Tax=Pelagibius sp. Alg239-R121 TaxID=2993448 RepID=UPI0024A60E74|nr:LysR substrate-binding domain-containing protein [Pelagibius sp. Alg239-R121]